MGWVPTPPWHQKTTLLKEPSVQRCRLSGTQLEVCLESLGNLKIKILKPKPHAVLRLHPPSDILICWVGRKKFEHWHNIKTPHDAGLLCWLGLFVLSCVQFDIIAGHLGRGNLVRTRDASIRVACRQASFSLTIGEGRLSPLWT